MKKIIVSVLVLGLAVSTALAELNVKVGADIGAPKGGSLGDVDTGITFAGDYLWTFAMGVVGVGAGVEYLAPRSNFSCLPIYATGKVKIPVLGLYAKLNLGFIPIIDIGVDVDGLKGGFYHSEAIGWEMLMGLFVEINYATYSYNFKNSGSSYYEKVGFNVGYRFGFI